MDRKADLVLEGGGVKGLGTAGAVIRLLEKKYTFPRAAGTSVGAMAAALVAAGAGATTLRRVMGELDLGGIPDRGPPRVPGLSEGLSLFTGSGLYRGDRIRDWIYEQLRDLGVVTFGDLRLDDSGSDPNLSDEQRYKLVVMATDVTHGRLLRLPWDYARLFHRDPDQELVADAVRMSLSIPFYFRPCTLTDPETGQKSFIVDGGVLSNFAVEIFDRTDHKDPRWPTFGIRLFPDLPAGIGDLFPLLGRTLPPPLNLLKQVVATAFAGHDQTHLDLPGVRERMISIDTSGVGITEFGLDEPKRESLLERGQEAAEEFLDHWNRQRRAEARAANRRARQPRARQPRAAVPAQRKHGETKRRAK
jgi:NTE family protein